MRVALAGFVLFFASSAWANIPLPNRDDFPTTGSNTSCSICHTAPASTQFMNDYTARGGWNAAMAALDSDGDGYSNGVELGDPTGSITNGGGNAITATNPSDAAQKPFCGNAVRQGTEACDDGNGVNGDACKNNCAAAYCGDGVVWVGVEACDDGDTDNDDACKNDCTPNTCGDGVVRTGVEQCDDGNGLNSDACKNDCTSATCGDGYVRTTAPAEACDDGNASNLDGCLNTCVVAVCGDSFVRTGFEACDDGNGISTDACRADCTAPVCGDNIVSAGEQCDPPVLGSCSGSCLVINPSCGDGAQQSGEQCDDGNNIDNDACRANCTLPVCGDMFVSAGEECDDGNNVNTDDCRNDCRDAVCGDAIVADSEDCDPPATGTCSATCTSLIAAPTGATGTTGVTGVTAGTGTETNVATLKVVPKSGGCNRTVREPSNGLAAAAILYISLRRRRRPS